MINIEEKSKLTINEQRDLNSLHFDGRKRYSLEFPVENDNWLAETINSEYFGDIVCAVMEDFNKKINDNPSLITAYNDVYKYGESPLNVDDEYIIYDNVQKSTLNIKISELLKFMFFQNLLSGKFEEKRQINNES